MMKARQRPKKYEAEVVLRVVIANVRAVSQDDAREDAEELFWERIAIDAKQKAHAHTVQVILRRLE